MYIVLKMENKGDDDVIVGMKHVIINGMELEILNPYVELKGHQTLLSKEQQAFYLSPDMLDMYNLKDIQSITCQLAILEDVYGKVLYETEVKLNVN